MNMAGLKNLLGRRGKRWSAEPGELPWYDRPDAEALLERRAEREKLDEKQFEMLAQWLREGYCVLDGLIDPGDIDTMLGDLEAFWEAETPTEGLEVLGARLKQEDPMALTHAELLALGAERRRELRDLSPWRVHGFHRFSSGARAIYENAQLLRATSLLFGRTSARDSTINFMYGSRQALHQDTVVFHVFPPNFLIGAWLACEDVVEGSGPLVYYPGSHRAALFDRFDNYPQTSLKTCDEATKEAYEAHLERAASRFERKTFLARRGRILLWHAMLIHGGAPVEREGLTRKSYVCHYMAEGTNVTDEIVGPFNW